MMQSKTETAAPVDPAQIWWGPTFQGTGRQAPAAAFVQKPHAAPWRWRYSRFVGIKYGPIPVGLIIAALYLLAH